MYDLPPGLQCFSIGGRASDGFCKIDNDKLPSGSFCIDTLDGEVENGICSFPLDTFKIMPLRMFNDLHDTERDRKHSKYVTEHCPEIRDNICELIEEYGMERPPATFADSLAKGIRIVEKTPEGLKITEGKDNPEIQRVAKKLGKKLKEGFMEELRKDFPTARWKQEDEQGESRRRKPFSEDYIYHQICRIKEEMRRGRTGSHAQEQRHEWMRHWIWALAHPDERDITFAYGRHFL